MTKVSFPILFQHVVISTYNNNIDLVDAMMASSNMPYFISPYLLYRFRGEYYIDGCFSKTLPIFQDHLHHQLLIKLYNIYYYRPYIYTPNDPSIEGLIVKGAIETDKFFSGKQIQNIKTLSWYTSNKCIRSKKTIFYYTLPFLGILYFYLYKKRNNT
jgi:hypothetical protein